MCRFPLHASFVLVLVALGAIPPATAAPTTPPPTLVSAPVITGSAIKGETLSASTGTWRSKGTVKYAYQWQRCDRAALVCGSIAGARSATYVLADADVGSRVRVVVTATNSSGSTSASALPTDVVALPVAPTPAPTPETDGGTSTPPTSGFSDAFDGTVLSSSWRAYSDPGASAGPAGGSLVESAPAGATSSYAGVISSQSYPLSGKAATVRLVDRGALLASSERYFALRSHGDPARDADWLSFTLGGSGTRLRAEQRVGGSTTILASLSFDPVAMAYWRMRESGGTIVFEYSSSASGPWSEVTRTANPLAVGSVFVEFGAGHYSATSADLIVKFDDASLTTAPTDPAPPPPAPSSGGACNATVFCGDWETGNMSQWTLWDHGGGVGGPYPGPGGGGVSVVTDPKAQGNYAGRIVVTPYSHASPAANSDSAYVYLPNGSVNGKAYGRSGMDDWYRFRILFPTDYRPACGYWNWVGAVHHSDDPVSYAGGNGAPYFGVYHDCGSGKSTYQVRILGGTLPRSNGSETWINVDDGSSRSGVADTFAPSLSGAALRKGVWYDIAYRVKWSPDPSVGRFELYLDGQLKFARTMATMWRTSDGYVGAYNFEQTSYRLHADWSATVYVDDARIGRTPAEVGLSQ